MEVQKVEQNAGEGFQAHARLLRSTAWQGIVSGILLIAEVILMLTAFYLSYLAQGEGGILVGFLGVLAILCALAGVGFAAWGITRRGRSHGACYIAGTGSLLVLAGIFWICVIM